MLIHFHAVLLWLHFTVDEITHSMLCWKWDPRHSSPQSALNMWTTNKKSYCFKTSSSLCCKLSLSFMAHFNKVKYNSYVNIKYCTYQKEVDLLTCRFLWVNLRVGQSHPSNSSEIYSSLSLLTSSAATLTMGETISPFHHTAFFSTSVWFLVNHTLKQISI